MHGLQTIKRLNKQEQNEVNETMAKHATEPDSFAKVATEAIEAHSAKQGKEAK